MSRVRVAYLIDSLGAGGSERSLVETLPHLVSAGIETRIYVLSQADQRFSQVAERAGVEIEALPPGSWPARFSAFRKRLRAWRPDVLHTTLFYSDILGRVAAWGTGVPVVSSLVSLRYEPARFADPRVDRWRFRVLQALESWTGRRLTTHFQAVSQAAKSSAVRTLRLREEAITVVRRGRDVERFEAPSASRRTRARANWSVPADDLLVVNVGRQTYHKAQLVLLEAMRELRDRTDLPLRLVIAGSEGPCSAELQEFTSRHGLGDCVQIAGHVDNVPELLAAADVFAFPSRLEGFPGAVLEAMAAGLPVAASDIAPVQEIFPADAPGALHFPCDRAAGLADVLEQLARDPHLRRELGARNRQTFLERYDIRETVPQLLDLYRRVAEAA